MQLARLEVSYHEVGDLPALVSQDDRPLVIRVSDADTVTVLAGVSEGWSGSWGVWLEASEHYSAGLIARDVKTLARLMQIDHVVVDAAQDSAAHAEVVAALLSDQCVTLHNAVADITGAYNRPGPPRPITVWSVEGDTLVHAPHLLRRRAARAGITFYRD